MSTWCLGRALPLQRIAIFIIMLYLARVPVFSLYLMHAVDYTR